MSEALEVGDEVLVFDVNGRRLGMDPNGEPRKVLKVGRKLVTLEDGYGRTATYRLDGQSRNDSYQHSWFRTHAQAAVERRRRDAVAALSEIGLEVSRLASLTTAEIEAAVDQGSAPCPSGGQR